MISNWVLGNFKSISGSQSIDLAPLTVLTGPNSAGKSTLLQSILLIAQTIRSSRVERPLLMNGEFVQLGSVDDVFHSPVRDPSSGVSGQSRYLEIGFSLAIPTADFFSDFEPNEGYSPTEVKFNLRFTKSSRVTSATLVGSPEIARLDLAVDSNSMDRDGEIKKTRSLLRNTRRQGTAGLPELLVEKGELTAASFPLRLRMSGSYAGAESRGRFSGRVIGPQSRQPTPTGRGALAELMPFALVLDRILPSMVISHYNEHQYRIQSGFDVLMSVLRRSNTNVASYLSRVPDEIVDQAFDILITTITQNPESSERFTMDQLQELINTEGNSSDRIQELLSSVSMRTRYQISIELAERETEVLEQHRGNLEPELGISRNPLPEPFTGAVRYVRRFFTTHLHYLGPLREEPRALYALPPSRDPFDIGLKGEYTAAVLDAHKNRPVEYWHPDQGRSIKGTLLEAVKAWLLHFGIADSVSTAEAGKLGYSMTIRKSSVSKDLDLTNVGVGVSQVLPILVMGLLAFENSTLIYEQPEIHLHPKIQSQLADFFIALANDKKQCIVETHSEYIINRIRRRIAESTDDSVLSQINMLFVENLAGHSTFRKVEINEYGAIDDWPDEFFDQSQLEADRIISAAMAKRRAENHA